MSAHSTGKISNLIDHVIIVLDESSSMNDHRSKLVAQTDALVKHLAGRSQELDRETRVSIWVFSYSHQVRCLVWDKDVLRLPSIAEFYRPNGLTALIDGTMDAISAHLLIPTAYGEHAFLMYVLTDGMENDSQKYGPPDLRDKLAKLPDTWTVAALVPDRRGVEYAKQVGFKAGNVETWDASSAAGVDAVSARIRDTTDRWQTGRAQGVRSTTTLFSTGADAVNEKTVRQAGLVALTPGSYALEEVTDRIEIREFVEKVVKMRYVVGRGFYELSKPEDIQPSKEIAIVSKDDGKVYFGESHRVRAMLGLPTGEQVRVRPNFNPKYTVFVQSTSLNRKVIPGTKFLYLR
jgi:hypothetical protein